MPSILFTSNSTITDVQSPACRTKPDRSKTRTIHTMHSSRQAYRHGASNTRSSPYKQSMTATSNASTVLPSIPAVVPKTSANVQKTSRSSSANIKQTFSPLLSAPPMKIQSTPQIPRASSATSLSSLASLSSVSSSSSSLSSSPDTSSINNVNDAYRRRYASYLASTFSISMDAALREADLQLSPRSGCDRSSSNICEAEVYRE